MVKYHIIMESDGRVIFYYRAVVYRRGVGGFKPLPEIPKALQNYAKLNPIVKTVKIEFRMPTPHDVWKKGSKILKLPPVHNCFTLAMTNKLVVIINSLKIPKIKKILLNEMKFLVRNYSCLQNPRVGGYRPQIPVPCPQLNLLNPRRTKFLGMPLLQSYPEVNGNDKLLCSDRTGM
jgi:hypothetical protein